MTNKFYKVVVLLVVFVLLANTHQSRKQNQKGYDNLKKPSHQNHVPYPKMTVDDSQITDSIQRMDELFEVSKEEIPD